MNKKLLASLMAMVITFGWGWPAFAIEPKGLEDQGAYLEGLGRDESLNETLQGILPEFLEGHGGGYGSNGKFLVPIEPIADDTDWTPLSDREGLEAIRNNLSGKYCLTADIDLSGTEWEPIGTSSGSSTTSFRGAFDGQGHVIRNMKITGDRTCNGLFGATAGQTIIKNVGLEGTEINVSKSGMIYAGGDLRSHRWS